MLFIRFLMMQPRFCEVWGHFKYPRKGEIQNSSRQFMVDCQNRHLAIVLWFPNLNVDLEKHDLAQVFNGQRWRTSKNRIVELSKFLGKICKILKTVCYAPHPTLTNSCRRPWNLCAWIIPFCRATFHLSTNLNFYPKITKDKQFLFMARRMKAHNK